MRRAIRGACDYAFLQRALFIRNPFDDATRELLAVTIGNAAAGTNGRGTGAVRFAPFGARLFGDGFD